MMIRQTLTLLFLLIGFSGYSQHIQTELRLLPGLAHGAEADPGDLGAGLYAGYERPFSDKWTWRAGLEMSTTAWAGQLLAEAGAVRQLRTWESVGLSARAALHTGMIWWRSDPPLLYGTSAGLRLQRTTGRWRWYVSPGIRWLNAPQYGNIAGFSSITDLEIRLGVEIGKAKK